MPRLTKRGFWLSVESLLALLLGIFLLLSFQFPQQNSLAQTIELQKQFDLIAVWQVVPTASNEMMQDIEKLFPNSGFEFYVNDVLVAQKRPDFFSRSQTVEGVIPQNRFEQKLIRFRLYD